MPGFSRLFALPVRDCLPEGSEWMELQLDGGLDLAQESPDLPDLHVLDCGSQNFDDPINDLPLFQGLLPPFSYLFCRCCHWLSPPFLSIRGNSSQFNCLAFFVSVW